VAEIATGKNCKTRRNKRINLARAKVLPQQAPSAQLAEQVTLNAFLVIFESVIDRGSPVIPTYTQGFTGSRLGFSRKMDGCVATASRKRIT